MAKLSIVVVSVFLVGCSLLVEQTQESLEGLSADKDAQKFRFLVHQSPAIRACVMGSGGSCTLGTRADVADAVPKSRVPGAKSAVVSQAVSSLIQPTADQPSNSDAVLVAAEAFTNPTFGKIEALFQQASGLGKPVALEPFSKRELTAFGKAIHEATSLDGWGQLRRQVAMASTADQEAATSTVAQLTLLRAYLSAYFSHGRFLSLQIPAKEFATQARTQLTKTFGLSDEAAKKVVARLLQDITKSEPDGQGIYHLATKLQDGGFVTRGGARYAFGGLSITLDPLAEDPVQASNIDFTQVGADVIRVFLEAMADEWGQLPAAGTSTACLAKNNKQLSSYANLACYDPDLHEMKQAEFDKVNERANQVEALTSTATGQLIRGISWISLNNEALAKLIETAVGVAARKATEKVTWCYYSCLAKAREDKADFADPIPQIRTVEIKLRP